MRTMLLALALLLAPPVGSAFAANDAFLMTFCRAETARAFNVTFKRVEVSKISSTVRGYAVTAMIDNGRATEKRVRCDFDVGGTFQSVREAPPGTVVW